MQYMSTSWELTYMCDDLVNTAHWRIFFCLTEFPYIKLYVHDVMI